MPSASTGGGHHGKILGREQCVHGFVRAANGTITDVRCSGRSHHGPVQGTVASSINAAGDITGVYSAQTPCFTDSCALPRRHNHLRSSRCGHGLRPGNRCPQHQLGGGYHGNLYGHKPSQTLPHCRCPRLRACCQWRDDRVRRSGRRHERGCLREPFPFSINTAGEITGSYSDTSGVTHGFVRAADGTMTYPIDAPSASTTGLFPGTLCASINDSGTFTGTYSDALGVFHGFVLQLAITPQAQVANLQNTVEALVSAGTLSPGLGQFLLAPLNACAGRFGRSWPRPRAHGPLWILATPLPRWPLWIPLRQGRNSGPKRVHHKGSISSHFPPAEARRGPHLD